MACRLGVMWDYLPIRRPSTLGGVKRTTSSPHIGTNATRAAERAPDGRLRVMLVDDHDVVREGLRTLLESTGDIAIVAEADTVAEAVAEALRTRPAVVVMDVRLPDGSGIEAAREIRSRLPDTRVLILTSFADDEATLSSITAGASGYVLKEVRGGEILRSLRAVARGESLLDADVAQAAMERVRKGKHLVEVKLSLLSPQEERILERVARGRTNHEIADEMGLAEKTVKNYVSNVLMKLEVGRRAEAAAYLARHSGPAG